MKRAGIALGLSVVLLAISNPQVPVQQASKVAFSYRGAGEGYGPVSISQPVAVAPAETQQEAATGDLQVAATLRGGAAHVHLGGRMVWTSDPAWDVRRMLVADVDNDGQEEAALVLWKPFRREPDIFYNTFAFPSPWDEGSQRNHLFIYGWRDDEWQPLWCSSPIADPIVELAAGDVDGDGANELVVLEGDYSDSPDQPAAHVTVWRWNGWGFGLQWRSPAGAYQHLTLCDANGDGILDIITEQR